VLKQTPVRIFIGGRSAETPNNCPFVRRTTDGLQTQGIRSLELLELPLSHLLKALCDFPDRMGKKGEPEREARLQ